MIRNTITAILYSNDFWFGKWKGKTKENYSKSHIAQEDSDDEYVVMMTNV